MANCTRICRKIFRICILCPISARFHRERADEKKCAISALFYLLDLAEVCLALILKSFDLIIFDQTTDKCGDALIREIGASRNLLNHVGDGVGSAIGKGFKNRFANLRVLCLLGCHLALCVFSLGIQQFQFMSDKLNKDGIALDFFDSQQGVEVVALRHLLGSSHNRHLVKLFIFSEDWFPLLCLYYTTLLWICQGVCESFLDFFCSVIREGFYSPSSGTPILYHILYDLSIGFTNFLQILLQ